MVKPGDTVYFYFMHAFCVPGRIDIDNAEALTGRFEMRCRIARVRAVRPCKSSYVRVNILEGTFDEIGDLELDLDVEFHDGDRIRVPGGSGCRPSRTVTSVRAHHGPGRAGELGLGWPDEATWAFQQKTLD